MLSAQYMLDSTRVLRRREHVYRVICWFTSMLFKQRLFVAGHLIDRALIEFMIIATKTTHDAATCGFVSRLQREAEAGPVILRGVCWDRYSNVLRPSLPFCVSTMFGMRCHWNMAKQIPESQYNAEAPSRIYLS
jgi:hypothetical protein